MYISREQVREPLMLMLMAGKMERPVIHMACEADMYPGDEFNQCDGCRAGMPINEHNHHECA